MQFQKTPRNISSGKVFVMSLGLAALLAFGGCDSGGDGGGGADQNPAGGAPAGGGAAGGAKTAGTDAKKEEAATPSGAVFTVDKETKRSYIDLNDLVKRGGVSFKSHY